MILRSSIFSLTTIYLLTTFAVSGAEEWGHWRGPRGDGVSSTRGLPTLWGTDKNIAWKVPLPEAGNSTPVVWQDRIFITQASATTRMLICYSLKNGEQLWKAGVDWSMPDPTHGTNPFCSSSPATDGQHVIVWHGSAGLYCYDMEGNQLWKRDFGIQKHIWGYGSSPVIYKDLCFLNFGPGERSFLVAVHKESGQTVWQHDEPIDTQGTEEAKFQNPDFYGSWSTPVIRDIAGKEQLILSFPFRIRSFDPRTGKPFWTSEGVNALVYTSPLIQDNLLIAMGGYNGMTVALEVQPDDRFQRLWRHPKTKQRIGSGVIHDGYIFIHNDPGVAECFDLKTGELVWEQRLSGPGGNPTNWSSVMVADGVCYTINQSGDCFVFRASPKFELIATNSLGETSNSSIVPADGKLLIRTHKHLWCITQ